MSPAPPAKPAVPQGKSFGKWISGHKWEAGLGGAGIAVTLFLAYRARQNAVSSSGTTSSTTAPTSSSALPVSYYPPMTGGGGGSFDAGQFGSVLSQLSQELNTVAGQQSQASQPSTPAASAPVAPTTPGMGLVDTAQGQMVWLGTWGQPTYQVGGGAPVYFGNAQSLAVGNPQAGEDVYTPTAYAGLVSAKPS